MANDFDPSKGSHHFEMKNINFLPSLELQILSAYENEMGLASLDLDILEEATNQSAKRNIDIEKLKRYFYIVIQ